MPLELIEHRDRPTQTNVNNGPHGEARSGLRRHTRRGFVIGGLLATAVVLGACAEGLQSDAERGRAEDAQRESVVKDLQATETWNRINGTPPSTPGSDE